MTGALKHSMNMTWVFKTMDVWPKKVKHVFHEDKYNCLFFIYTKQLTPSNYMKVRKQYTKS